MMLTPVPLFTPVLLIDGHVTLFLCVEGICMNHCNCLREFLRGAHDHYSNTHQPTPTPTMTFHDDNLHSPYGMLSGGTDLTSQYVQSFVPQSFVREHESSTDWSCLYPPTQSITCLSPDYDQVRLMCNGLCVATVTTHMFV